MDINPKSRISNSSHKGILNEPLDTYEKLGPQEECVTTLVETEGKENLNASSMFNPKSNLTLGKAHTLVKPNLAVLNPPLFTTFSAGTKVSTEKTAMLFSAEIKSVKRKIARTSCHDCIGTEKNNEVHFANL